MNKISEPFYYSQLECPVCKTMNEYENIRSGSFSESGKDTDFCPSGRVWQNPLYQNYDPLLFFIATCKKCFYSREFNQEYKNWKDDTAFKTYRLKGIQENHLTEYTKDGVVKLLGSHVDQKKYPFESAVIKLLLAIFDEKLLTRRSNLDVGRFFLRIAWLFRNSKNQSASKASSSVEFFSKLHLTAVNSNEMLSKYDIKIKNLHNLIDSEFSLVFDSNPETDDYKEQMKQAVGEINSALESLKKTGLKLLNIFSNAEKTLLVGEESSNEIFYDYSSFETFLMKAKKLWNEIPLSENDALKKASEYYQKAYETDSKLNRGVQQIQATYLIAEISRRAEDFETATQYFNQTIKLAHGMVQGKKGDSSTIKYTKRLLEMAMDQARLNKRQLEGTQDEKVKV